MFVVKQYSQKEKRLVIFKSSDQNNTIYSQVVKRLKCKLSSKACSRIDLDHQSERAKQLF